MLDTETVFAAAMFILRHDFSDSLGSLLRWLFPLTYLLHIAEEYWADFPARLLQTQGVQLSIPRFLTLQILGLSLMSLGIVLSKKFGFTNRLLLILAAVVLGNSLVHLGRSVWFGAPEPGLISALLLWLPLSTLTLWHTWPSMNRSRYVIGVVIGFAICAAVEIVTISGP